MVEAPDLIEIDAQDLAVIRLAIPRAEMSVAMGPAIAEVIAAASEQGVGPAGPVVAHHFRAPDETFDFEVGVPVTAPIAPKGRVQPARRPAMRAVRTTHRGPYEGLPAAWGAFDAWLKDQGILTAGEVWETYMRGPESSEDPSTWQTELMRPVIRAPIK